MADDYANTNCGSLKSWANGNGMSGSDAFFSDSDISMSDYGQPGMPKVIVVGCAGHKVYYNENYTAAGIEEAIDEALLDCESTSIADSDQNNSDLNIHLSPNPVANYLTASFELMESSFVSIDIINMTGNTVLTVTNTIQNAGYSSIEINTAHLPDGFYFLRVQSGKKIQVNKFSVSH